MKKGRGDRPFWGLRVAVAAIVFPAVVVAAGGGKLPGGEGNPGENFAGFFRQTRIVAAFFGGQGVIQHRDDQLGIPLQTDDGKLTQSYIKPPVIPGELKRFVEHLLNEFGDLVDGGFVTFLAVPDLGTQNHGIQHFHH